jgi:hypothetical protein
VKDTKTGGKGVTRIGCKEVGKQGLNAEIIGGKITQTDVAADNGLIHIMCALSECIAAPFSLLACSPQQRCGAHPHRAAAAEQRRGLLLPGLSFTSFPAARRST